MPKLLRMLSTQRDCSSKSYSSSPVAAIEPQVNGVYHSRSCIADETKISTMATEVQLTKVMAMGDGESRRIGSGDADAVDHAAARGNEAAVMDASSEVFSIYDGNIGVDNHGHNIAELRLKPPITGHHHNTFLATPPATPLRTLAPASTTASTAALTDPATATDAAAAHNMTPTLVLRPRLGRRTSLAIDAALILILAAWIGVIELGLIPATRRGFYCDDRSIAFPYRGETITTAMILTSIPVPFVLMWIGEAIFYKPASIKSTRLRKSLGSASFWFRDYFIGMVLHLFLMDAVKVLVGELRPHFLDTCKPDAAVNCTAGVFISDYKCTSTEYKAYIVRDSSKSFPSGHSSISFFEAVFMVWYIHRRVPQLRSRLLVPTAQTLLFFWACFVSFSRIVDHRHHWWDVLLGANLGIVFGVLTCLYLCKDFKRKPAFAQDVGTQNGNPERHTSVRRLLAEPCCKDEVTMSHVIVT